MCRSLFGVCEVGVAALGASPFHVTRDNGAHWQSFQLNLPNVPITDLKLHHDDLIVSTQGRAFWMIDNVTSLQQFTPQSTAGAVRLYQPRDGYRTRAAASYQPVIEYFLPASATGTVTIDILDAKGQAVNSYNSETPAPDPEAAGGSGGGRGRGGPPSRVTKTPGLNRFTWDVQHASGFGAPPGAYQVKLTANGQTLTQPLTVLIDPRLAAEGVTAADLQEQFDHIVRMRELVASLAQVAARVRDALSKNDPRAAPLAAKLFVDPPGVRYGKPGLQEQINYLAGMTRGVDQKIGRDAIERYHVLKNALEDLRLEVDRVLGKL